MKESTYFQSSELTCEKREFLSAHGFKCLDIRVSFGFGRNATDQYVCVDVANIES